MSKLSGLARYSPRANAFAETFILGRPAPLSVRYFVGTSRAKPSASSGDRTLKIIGGVAIGGLALMGYSEVTSSYQRLFSSKQYTQFDNVTIIDEIPPEVQITRKVVNANDKSGLDLILFQYQTCPYCCKVRAYLDAAGFTYSVVEVNAVLRQSIKWSKYKKVPMMLARTKDGKYIQLTESSMIISALSSHKLDPSVDLRELAGYYPHVSIQAEGKTTTEILNKYFVMHKENVPINRSTEEIT